ncbi:MAG: hypothetical protein AB1679_12970 [Actinomycetota bacterium]|jgi:hypothetical protein
MRARSMASAIGLGCAGLTLFTVLTLVTPATGQSAGPPDPSCASSDCPMPAGPVAADCEDAAMNTARDGSDAVRLTADIPDGSRVAPGQDIAIRLTWDPTQWSGEALDMALACTWVKGGLNPDMSGQERPSPNDGVFEFRVEVPHNIRPDCDICIQGFLAGMTGSGPQQVGSDRRCFMSGPPGSPTPPATRPPTPPATRPPTTPATSPPAPATTPPAPATTPPVPAGPTGRVPAEVGGIQASQPSPAPLTPAPTPAPPPAMAAAAELPRTGSPLAQVASAGGGLMLSLGGLAVIGGAGRRSRRRKNG